MGSIDTDTVAATAEVIKIPVIDISEPTVEVGKRLVAAASKYGFLYIDTKGTGFTKENVDRIFKLSENFFASPIDQKQACQIQSDNRGYSGMHSETLDPKLQKRGDFKECMNVGEFYDDGKPRQHWPAAFQENEDEMFAFQKLCRQTCWNILDLLAIGLEVEEPKFFSSRHTIPSGSTLRFLKYPAIPDEVDDYQPEVDIRAGAHSDYGSCTLLFQRPGQPGLEIKTPEDEWAPVAVIPDGYDSDFPPILINIGDLMSYWTNGLLRSTVHRVIFPTGARKGEDRYSTVWFFHPETDARLVPIPSRIVQALKPIEDGTEVGYGGGAATKKATTAHEHLMNRLAATYGFAMDKAGK